MATNESGGTTLDGGAAGGTRGTTTIADNVVSTIAGIAVRETDGVHSVGKGPSRAIGAVRDRVSRSSDPGRGVKVEVGEKQTAIDVDIVVEYGAPIRDTARSLRTNVTDAVETMTGLDVVEININVTDVHVPGSDDDEDEDESSTRSSRVQ
ncbi:Asp23/Gls24 family envelope stress response protein [Streptomyces sp. CB02460]|uniref:Asp23/Gls24 family envelope stress response protein n=1 Tax=Streptomyces sp. CB02460 TaxID=1703941 RepID=UPI00093BF799|nr:Asp23/Gls24 family envelope stress response protein [Streptomyces sp. CB02460]OKJ68516.1 stress-like protein [Streptomyces sp. CB02460]